MARKYKLGALEGEPTARSATPGLTPIQVDAILELQLHRLTQLSVDEILKELKSIREHIAELEEILSSDKKLKQVITGELKEVQKAYGDDRRTQIVDKVDEIKLEDLIADTEMLITVSHAGYIKRTAADTYRHQSRGGKGRIGARTKEEDFVEYLFVASAHSYILLFTSKGRVYWIKVYELPEAAAATRGKAISSLVKFQEDEKLTALVAARNLEEAGQFVFMATRNGTVKKSALTEFSNPRSTGIIAITLDGKDELIGAKLTDGKKMIFWPVTKAKPFFSAKRKFAPWVAALAASTAWISTRKITWSAWTPCNPRLTSSPKNTIRLRKISKNSRMSTSKTR